MTNEIPEPDAVEAPTEISRLQVWFNRNRSLIRKFVFELVVVFVGVTAAFAMEDLRQRAKEAEYRRSMISALGPTLDDVIQHNAEFEQEVGAKLAAFDAAIARGERPALPIFRDTNSERPPVRAWDGIVATGAAKSLEPGLFFELALFYTRQESIGERYIRYNSFTETRVLTLGPDPAALYDLQTGRLKPEFAAHVDRLRDLQTVETQLTLQAVKLRNDLARAGRGGGGPPFNRS